MRLAPIKRENSDFSFGGVDIGHRTSKTSKSLPNLDRSLSRSLHMAHTGSILVLFFMNVLIQYVYVHLCNLVRIHLGESVCRL